MWPGERAAVAEAVNTRKLGYNAHEWSKPSVLAVAVIDGGIVAEAICMRVTHVPSFSNIIRTLPILDFRRNIWVGVVKLTLCWRL